MNSHLKTLIFALGAMATVGSYAAHAQETAKMKNLQVPFTVVVEGVNPPATPWSFHISGTRFKCNGNNCVVDKAFTETKKFDIRLCMPKEGPACNPTSHNSCETEGGMKATKESVIPCVGDLSNVKQGAIIKAIVNVNGCSCTLAP